LTGSSKAGIPEAKGKMPQAAEAPMVATRINFLLPISSPLSMLMIY
jgi:hypothetical protein